MEWIEKLIDKFENPSPKHGGKMKPQRLCHRGPRQQESSTTRRWEFSENCYNVESET